MQLYVSIEVQLENTETPEPCLWDIVKEYYVKGGFSWDEAENLTDKYFNKLEQLSKD